MLAEKYDPIITISSGLSVEWAVGVFEDFGALQWCSGGVGGAAADKTGRTGHNHPTFLSPASGGQLPPAKGCPAPGSTLQLSWPSSPPLPRSLHNWLKLPLAASPRPPSSRSPGSPTAADFLSAHAQSTHLHLFAQIQFSPFSP